MTQTEIESFPLRIGQTSVQLLSRSLLAALFIPAAYGDQEDAERFLTIPGIDKSFHGRDLQTFKPADLPPGIPALLKGFWENTGGKFPDSFLGYSLDLNKDGQKEYFIETPLGGSGGPHFVVLAEAEGQWREIMTFQGGFHILKAKSGWPRIVTYTRGGGGNYAKEYWRHDHGAYHLTATERHEPVIPKSAAPISRQ